MVIEGVLASAEGFQVFLSLSYYLPCGNGSRRARRPRTPRVRRSCGRLTANRVLPSFIRCLTSHQTSAQTGPKLAYFPDRSGRSSHLCLPGSPLGDPLLFLENVLLINWKPLCWALTRLVSLLCARLDLLPHPSSVSIELNQCLQGVQYFPIRPVVKAASNSLLLEDIELDVYACKIGGVL